ncbi:MAG: cell division protein ZapB [Magnetococcales bacterium]|nr:cell division protein ZapB [Magnetococcales bacterium]
MNLSEQPISPALHHEPVTAGVNPLAQLEARLNDMTGTIAALKNKVSALQEVITHREQRITTLETENTTLKQQMDRFTASHNQLLDDLTDMLARFPSEETQWVETTTMTQMDLLAKTVGTA